VALIVAVAGGEAAPAADVQPVRPSTRSLTLRNTRVRQVVGTPFGAKDVAALLRSVGFTAAIRPGTEMLTGSEELVVTVPSWRGDVSAEIDLVEEVARLHGYDAIPDELRAFRVGNVPDDPAYELERRLQDALVAAGLFEVRPLPFVAGEDSTHARLANPIAENEAHLRRTILETLARRAEYNLAHMQGNVRIFEVGSVFTPVPEVALPSERRSIGILVMGDRRPAHFTEPKPPRYDVWDAKGLAEVAARVAYPDEPVTIDPPAQNAASNGTGVLWSIAVAGEPRGVVRTVALDAPVWAAPAYGIEIDLGDVGAEPVAPPGQSAHGATQPPPRPRHLQYRPLPVTPAAELDLALIVPDSLRAGDVERVIRRNGGDLLERVGLFDEFRGGGLPAGSRSLAWRLTFRDPSRTLRDKEVEGRTQKILRALEEQLGVRQRTT
jgi:phenylalanyl-tRNA synthetase beta chain